MMRRSFITGTIALFITCMVLTALVFAVWKVREDDLETGPVIFRPGSIFNGTTIDSLARFLARSLDSGLLDHGIVENVKMGIFIRKYHIEDDMVMKLEYCLNEGICNLLNISVSQTILRYGTGDFNGSYAKNIVNDIWMDFLDMFDRSIPREHEITVSTDHLNLTWKVDLVQLIKGESRQNTGLTAFIHRRNGDIRYLEIRDWEC